MASTWSGAVERMLARVDDTASRVSDGFPHRADPDSGHWTTTRDYLFESLLALEGRLAPCRL